MIDAEKKLYFASWLVSRFINIFKKPKRLDFSNILIIRLDEIGDMTTTLPALALLHSRYPDAKMTVWCKGFVQPLLENVPYITCIITKMPEAAHRYDLIIDLRGTWQTLWYALKNRPKLRLDRGSVRLRNKFFEMQHPHEVFTNIQVMQPLLHDFVPKPIINIYTSKRNDQAAQLFLQRNSIQNFALLHTGARKKLRRWHPQKFADLATHLHQIYGLDIIFVGDNTETYEILKIQQRIGFQTFSFAGQGSLMDYVALSQRATLMVGNESGPVHLAAATNIPTLALFGPGEPHIFAPYGANAHYLHHKLACNPCNQIDCILPKNPCINHIELHEVTQKIAKILPKN
jgi:ADP-heptose:LPS heptosyltransferase